VPFDAAGVLTGDTQEIADPDARIFPPLADVPQALRAFVQIKVEFHDRTGSGLARLAPPQGEPFLSRVAQQRAEIEQKLGQPTQRLGIA
jgi:hypothetical protein